jgi:predicted Rossmann fold flavoprotein
VKNSCKQESGYDVIVIGAGASGLMAAGMAGASGARVLLLEKMSRAGLKLGITGKGRCNVTNLGDLEDFIRSYSPDGRFLRNCFARFFNRELMTFFEDRGVPLVVERGQRVFPKSNRALDIVSALLRFIRDEGVVLLKEHPVQEILQQEGRVQGVVSRGTGFKASQVVLACGGASYPQTGSDGEGYVLARKAGHSLTAIRPWLIPLEVREPWIKDLQGLSLKNVTATFYLDERKIASEFGEMLFTHFGVSGPIILTLSGKVADLPDQGKRELSINFKPALSQEQLDERLQRELKLHHLKGLQGILPFLVPKALIPVILDHSKIPGSKKGNQITSEERARLRKVLTDFRLSLTGTRPLEEAIVTAGGVRLKEVDPKTMESKILAGLFLCGEVLDIQGKTGGYNLQAAFSTGWAAGKSAALKALLKKDGEPVPLGQATELPEVSPRG